MRMVLNLLLALLLTGAASLASAVSLGEGQILSRVGERLSVNIALSGGYSKDVKFFQVRNAECRSSVIGTNANGCDGLYEGPLTFAVKQRPDGQYFLRVTGEKGGELYYRIVIKTVSPDGGTIFNAFEFLPEFGASPDAQPAVADEADVLPGKYGVVGGKIIEVPADDEKALPVRNAAQATADKTASGAMRPKVDQERARRAAGVRAQEVEASVKKQPGARLEIKKYGDYSDDIHALQKENGEIEQQIVLLEKHINLLREVIRLKNQIGSSAVPEVGTAAAPSRPHARAPVQVQSQSATGEGPGLLTWILLVVIVVLLALLGWMYRTQQKLKKRNHAYTPSVLSPVPLNERKSLDLTDAFVKPKW